MKKDSIGNRMKENYENRYRIKLTRRIPVIIRLDGRAFHTLTRKCEKPFDKSFYSTMIYVSKYLCDNIQGVKCAYVQSDEISILLTDYDRLNSDAWFDYNKSKIETISSSMASVIFTNSWGGIGLFDSRSFNIPKEEVCNYFIWRQQDWIRNSITMYTRSLYTHKELYKKNQSDMHEMIHSKGLNWADLKPYWKNGTLITKNKENIWEYSYPIFTKDRQIVENLLIPLEE